MFTGCYKIPIGISASGPNTHTVDLMRFIAGLLLKSRRACYASVSLGVAVIVSTNKGHLVQVKQY